MAPTKDEAGPMVIRRPSPIGTSTKPGGENRITLHPIKPTAELSIVDTFVLQL
jgi:hypothetical protein